MHGGPPVPVAGVDCWALPSTLVAEMIGKPPAGGAFGGGELEVDLLGAPPKAAPAESRSDASYSALLGLSFISMEFPAVSMNHSTGVIIAANSRADRLYGGPEDDAGAGRGGIVPARSRLLLS